MPKSEHASPGGDPGWQSCAPEIGVSKPPPAPVTGDIPAELWEAEVLHRERNLAQALMILACQPSLRMRALEADRRSSDLVAALSVLDPAASGERRCAEALHRVLRAQAMLAEIASARPVELILRLDRAVVLPTLARRALVLITTELFTNSLKHAFPGARRGRVQVTLDRASRRSVEMRYSDNGVGLGSGREAGAGHSLMRRLAQAARGRFTVLPAACGFAAKLILPSVAASMFSDGLVDTDWCPAGRPRSPIDTAKVSAVVRPTSRAKMVTPTRT